MNKKILTIFTLLIILILTAFIMINFWQENSINSLSSSRVAPSQSLKITEGIVYSSQEIFDDCMQKAEKEDAMIFEENKKKSECRGGTWCENIYPAKGTYFLDDVINCISESAIFKKDVSLCDNEKGNEEINKKWSELLFKSGSGVSPKMIEFIKEKCILSYMFGTADLSVVNIEQCQLFSNEDIKNECVKKTASMNKDESECEKITNENEKDSCYDILSTEKMDHTVCLKISNEIMQANCLRLFAYRNHDERLCDYHEEDFCKKSMGILKNNSIKICDTIDCFDGACSGKESCLLAFSIYNRDPTICAEYKNKGPFINDVCERYTK